MIIEPGSELGYKDIEAQRGASTSQAAQLQDHRVINSPASTSTAAAASASASNGPTENSNDPMHLNAYSDLEPLGPPPAFAPYEAEWFEVGNGDVVSHDEHLNTDGEALYRFLLTQASQSPPTYRIHCRGSHIETRYRFVSSHSHHHHHHHQGGHHHHSGATSTHTESYPERVTDFDFHIDVTPPFSPFQASAPSPSSPPVDTKSHTGPPGVEHDNSPQDDLAPIHWTVADNEPVCRGKMVREVEATRSGSGISLPETDLPLLSSPRTQLRKATRRERKDYAQWIKDRTLKGLPPWATPSTPTSWNTASHLLSNGSTPTMALLPTSREVLKSSKTMREWADEYCASPKLLKEFVYTKQIYGWDISQLQSAIRSTIALAPYAGDIQVDIEQMNSKIYVRPSNSLSRALSNKWLKFVSIIFLVFPFVWLFKMFHKKGGGKWEVCGGAYAMKRMIPIQNDGYSEGTELPSYDDIAGPSTLPSSPSFPLPSTSSSSSSPSSTPFSPQQTQSQSAPRRRIIYTPQGPHKLIGQREGEWFRHWEPVILRSVITRYKSSVPLTSHGELYGGVGAPGSALEGYYDAPTETGLPVAGSNVDLRPGVSAGYQG